MDIIFIYEWLVKEVKGFVFMIIIIVFGRIMDVDFIFNIIFNILVFVVVFDIEDWEDGSFCFVDWFINEFLNWLWDFGDGNISIE